MPSFFSQEPHLIKAFLLIWDSYMTWSTRFVSLCLCVGLSIFDSISFLLKFICVDSLTLKRHNSFQNYKNRKAAHSFATRLLIFKLQQGFKIHWYLHELELSKNWPRNKFFKLRISKFWECQFFFSTVIFK